MLVLGSTLAPSMLHTAAPAFPVVVPPSESRRMISTWHSHNRVFRQLLLTFLNSDIICDGSQERWGHFALLVASIWSVDAKLWTLSRNFPTFIPATSFPFPICLVKVFCLVRVKTSSGWERPKRKKISTYGDAGCCPLLQGERCVGSDSCHDNRKEASWLKCICFSVLQRSQLKTFVDARQKENCRLHFASGIASWFCVPITSAI